MHELISSGCCQLYADVRYRLLPTTERITDGGRSISMEVTAVTVGNARDCSEGHCSADNAAPERISLG